MSFGPCIAELDAALNRKKKIEKTLFYISLCFAKLISRVLEIKVHKGAKRVNCRQMESTSFIKPAPASMRSKWVYLNSFSPV